MMSEASLPENWTRCVSKTFKQYYYFNNVTNESSWIHPLLKSGSRKGSTSSVENEKESPKKKLSKQINSSNEDKTSFKQKTQPVSRKAMLSKNTLPTHQESTTRPKRTENLSIHNNTSSEKHGKKNDNTSGKLRKKKKKNRQKESDKSAFVKTHDDPKTGSEKQQHNDSKNPFKKSVSAMPAVKSDVVRMGKTIPTVHKSHKYQPYQKNDSCFTKMKNDNSKPGITTTSTTITNPVTPSSSETAALQNPFFRANLSGKSHSPVEPQSQNLQHGQFNVEIDFHRNIPNDPSVFTNTNFAEKEFKNNNTDVLSTAAEKCDADTEEHMDIDDDPHIIREISKQIKGFREENVLSRPVITTEDQHLGHADLPTYTDPLYIVLDTNVLLGHLKFIQDLKDYPIPGIGAPILYIPWIVLQELDGLKDAEKRCFHTEVNKDGETKSYQLSVFARNAINFVNNCLQMEHPRLKGQTAIEAGTLIEGFVEETNDDSIIHAALGLKLRAIHSHIVLFSNDRNLCNKTMVAGIKAFSYQNLMMGLRSLFQSGTIAVRKENFAEYFEEFKIQDILAKRRKQADELSCELQCILREGLSKIIEDEMKEAYGEDLWLKIVKIQPPWTLHDVFDLLEKHWIAVFGLIVNRRLVEVVKGLKKQFQACNGISGSLEKSKELLELSLKIFECFAIRSSYGNMCTQCVTGVKVLIKKCEEFIKQMVPLKQITSTSITVRNVPEHPEEVPSSEVPVGNDQQGNLYEKVMVTFEAIWQSVRHYSALIFYSLDFPSPLIKEIDPNEPKPHPKEALNCLSTLTKCLLSLIRRIQVVIRIPVEDLTNSEQTILKLLEGIFIFMKEVMKQDCHVQPTELLHFCQDGNTRATLIQGLSQLDRSYAMLQQCVEYHQTVV